MDDEVIDGCQVVRMYDKAIELSNLLKAIYDGVTFQNHDIEDFFYLASILRLATKYLISNIRHQAIQALAQTWSYTLEGHDAMVERALQASIGIAPTDLTYPYVHPLHVLNLARETNVRLVIPSALYFLSIYPFSDLLQGTHPKLLVESRTGLTRPAATLSMEDMGHYTLMYQHRIELILDFARRCIGEKRAYPNCEHEKRAGPSWPLPKELSTEENDPCSFGFARLASRASRSWYPRTGPLRWMLQMSQRLMDDPRVCKNCKESFKEDTDRHRESIWKRLPGVVNLPDWNTLIESDLAHRN